MSYFNPATIPAELKAIPRYNSWRGVENLVSGHRTRQPCGFFITPRQTTFNGSEGMGIPEYHPPSLHGFEPPSRPFWASATPSKTVRNAAMMACPTVCLPAVRSSSARQEVRL